jgi:hypothetical protein
MCTQTLCHEASKHAVDYLAEVLLDMLMVAALLVDFASATAEVTSSCCRRLTFLVCHWHWAMGRHEAPNTPSKFGYKLIGSLFKGTNEAKVLGPVSNNSVGTAITTPEEPAGRIQIIFRALSSCFRRFKLATRESGSSKSCY